MTGNQMDIFGFIPDPDTWSGKTFPEPLAATKVEISRQSSRKSSESRSRMHLTCLCLKKGDGRTQDASLTWWGGHGALRGEYTMRSFGECPSEENASRLSQILEDSPHPKYYLSAKACVGILRRAKRRGKALPPELETALIAQSEGMWPGPSPQKTTEARTYRGPQIIIQGCNLKTGALTGNVAGTLTTENRAGGDSGPKVICLQGNGIDRADTARCNGKGWSDEDVSYTLNTIDRHAVYDARGNGDGLTAPTLTGDHESRVTDYTTLCVGNGQLNQISMAEQANTLDTMHDQQAIYIPDSAHSLRAKSACDFREDSETYIVAGVVRRLTPLECERLQGYPDGWTDIGAWMDTKSKRHKDSSDSARYKALGNSIAIPFWFYLLRRISAQYERPATLGSLFDGIGGFPLCWERCNGPGTALWASEIEEFPIAVTKKHFPEFPSN